MKTSSDDGFTLLEMVVTLVIATVLLAVVAPNLLSPRDHAALVAAARDVAEGFRLTQSRAIGADQPVAFVVDVDNARFREGGSSWSAPTLPAGTRIALYTAREKILANRTGRILFYPDGSSSGGGVALSHGGDRIEVLVDWLTGEVSVHEGRQVSR